MQRALNLDFANPEISKFKALLSKRIGNLTIKTIASAIKWHGCHGFNRLLHDHTSYGLVGIFNFPSDISYSQGEYVFQTRLTEFEKKQYKYCPQCCREDIAKIGFPYWRRSHQLEIGVCGRHNVKLISSCPHCDKSFTSFHKPLFLWPGASPKHYEVAFEFLSEHLLDVIWAGCEGKQIWEIDAEESSNVEENKQSRFYNDLLGYRFCIPIAVATHVLYEKSSSSNELKALDWTKITSNLASYHHSSKLTGNERRESKRVLCEEIIKAASALYQGFDDFINDIKLHSDSERPLEALWCTYASEGVESVNYIQEDYVSGVGNWSCPYPSSESNRLDSRDGINARHPKKYPCCNVSNPPVGSLVPWKARPPMPKIPTLMRVLARAGLSHPELGKSPGCAVETAIAVQDSGFANSNLMRDIKLS